MSAKVRKIIGILDKLRVKYLFSAALILLFAQLVFGASAPRSVFAAAAPDIDTFFCRSPELFLALHRGITHSLPALPLFSLILALAFRPLWRRGADDAFSFVGTWIFCAACVLLHIWLDCITTFGTMILQPFSDLRVRLNGVFIVDLILTVPLLVLTVCALRRKNARRRLAAAGLIWIFLYPAGAIAANLAHTATLRTELASEGISVREITIFPDVFSPFFWRAVSLQEKDGHFTVHEQSLDYRASLPPRVTVRPLQAVPEFSYHARGCSAPSGQS